MKLKAGRNLVPPRDKGVTRVARFRPRANEGRSERHRGRKAQQHEDDDEPPEALSTRGHTSPWEKRSKHPAASLCSGSLQQQSPTQQWRRGREPAGPLLGLAPSALDA